MTLIELVTMKKEYIRRKSMGIFNMDYPKMVKDSGKNFQITGNKNNGIPAI